MSSESSTTREPHYWFGDGTTKMPVTTAVLFTGNNKPTLLRAEDYQALKRELFILGQYVFDDLRYTRPPREEGERRLVAIDEFSEYIMGSVELHNDIC